MSDHPSNLTCKLMRKGYFKNALKYIKFEWLENDQKLNKYLTNGESATEKFCLKKLPYSIRFGK